MSKTLGAVLDHEPSGSQSENPEWIVYVPPPNRPTVRLFREPVELFVDPTEAYPTAKFVKYEGDYEVI
jgi:hypothetical protein